MENTGGFVWRHTQELAPALSNGRFARAEREGKAGFCSAAMITDEGFVSVLDVVHVFSSNAI